MTDETGEQRTGYERTVAFSDGVFAIAITLLVLSLTVPDVRDQDLGDAIRGLGDNLVAYFIGFAVMGLFWMGHHSFFGETLAFDRRLLVLNLVYLSFIALMPFTTGLISDYGDVALAVAIYAANVAAAALVDAAMTVLALRERLLVVKPGQARDLVVMGLLVPAVFLASIPIAYVDPGAAKWSWLSLLVLPRLLHRTKLLRPAA